MQGCLLVDSHKSAGSGPVRSPASCPSKKPNKKTQPETKETKHTKKHTTTPKPKTNKTPRSGIATSNGNNMHDDILCVIMRMATELEAKQRKHRGPGKRMKEATKLNAETRDPPSQDPRDHREQPYRHSIHPGTSKQTPTTPRHSGRTQSPLSRSFPSIIIIDSCRAPLRCMLLSKLYPMRSS